MAKGDSAPSHYYWHQADIKVMSDMTHNPGRSVLLPTDNKIEVTS